jgi:phosphopantothenoylcysteine decarboxylase/phosphopantothenate--cysteine ligase
MNSLNDKGAGFGNTTNKITIIDKDFNQIAFTLKNKKDVANDIINELIRKIDA